MKTILFFLSLIFVLACQQKPTIVTTENKTVLAVEPSVRKLVNADTIIIDARTPFEYGLNHVPGSINLQWQDFSVPGSLNKGILDQDKFKLARRLALLGIDSESSVLIIGPGKKGEGQEGRLAWMFKLLGLTKVTTMNYDLLKSQVAENSELRLVSKPMWKPLLNEDYEINFEDFYTLLRAHQVKNHLPSMPIKQGVRVGRKIQGAQVFVIDVRDQKEIGKTAEPVKYIAAEVIIKMPWTDFWSEQGQVNHEVIRELTQLGVRLTDEIVVLSQTGVTSAGAVYALRELGYLRAQNFSGGLYAIENMKKPTAKLEQGPGGYR